MKRSIYIFTAVFCFLAVSCKKDVFKDVDNGKWNHERNITEIMFGNQIGLSEIERDGDHATVSFRYNIAATGSLKIPILSIVPSYGATASVKEGDVLDFDNPTNSAVVTITARDGRTLDWEIYMTPFEEQIQGTWSIVSMIVHGGVDWGYYWGDAFNDLTNDRGLNDDYFLGNKPEAEADNRYIFTVTGISAEGNPVGTFVNEAGPDGQYGTYIFNDTDNGTGEWNLESLYRCFPTGGGTWEHNTVLGKYYFRNSNGQLIFEANFSKEGFTFWSYGAGYDFLPNTFTINVENKLSTGLDGWDYFGSKLDQIVISPFNYYVTLKKEE